ncbi:MAG: hypothetical protein ACO3AC_01535 [Hylemonella sp.]
MNRDRPGKSEQVPTMVNEAAYRRTRLQVNPLPCVFQSALLAQHAQCKLAQKKSLAEREGLSCSQPTAHLNCELLEQLLLERATFALQLHPKAPMTHAKVMKLQCGGLLGMREVMDAPQADVHALLVLAQERYGSLRELPWSSIVQSIAHWQVRRRAP